MVPIVPELACLSASSPPSSFLSSLTGRKPPSSFKSSLTVSVSVSAVHSAGGIAAKAEDLKREKYADLFSSHIFVPIAIETSGVFGSKTLSFVKSLGKRLYRHSGDHKSTDQLII